MKLYRIDYYVMHAGVCWIRADSDEEAIRDGRLLAVDGAEGRGVLFGTVIELETKRLVYGQPLPAEAPVPPEPTKRKRRQGNTGTPARPGLWPSGLVAEDWTRGHE